MEWKVFCFIIIVSLSLAATHNDEEEYYDYSLEEDTSKERKPAKLVVKQDPILPAPGYEVTENVVDIPSPNPQLNLIVTNYATRKPLNLVPVNVNNNSGQTPNVTPKNEPINIPNYFDNKENPDVEEIVVDDEHENSHEGFHEVPHLLASLRSYLYGLEKGIINGLNTLVEKGIFRVNKNVNEPNTYSNPVSFLEKLRRKSHLAKNSKYYGHEFDDY